MRSSPPRSTAAVRRVEVRLLGPISVLLDGVPSPLRNRSDLLLARLIAEPRAHPREDLAAWLWPDAPREARLHSLREGLRRLRSALGEVDAARPLLDADRATVQLRAGPELTSDFTAVRDHVAFVAGHDHRRVSACAPCLERLRSVAAAAGSAFAEGDWDASSAPVAQWVESWRSRLRGDAAWALGALADAAAERGDAVEALAASEAQLRIDPWEEAAHRRILRAYAATGRTAQAVAWYESMAARLERELGVAPDDATEELYQSILHGETAAEAEVSPIVPPPVVTSTANAFVGREADLAWFDDALARADARWFTITGVGGIGKSRLAREVGRRAGPSFRSGAAFVPLGAVTDPDRFAAEVALALRLSVAGVRDVAQHVGEWLRTREVLLVLDTLEHLPEASLVAASWVERAPGLRVLATSRERMGLACEHVWPLDGLPSQDDDGAAVRLWVARTRQLDPHRLLDPDELAGARRIGRLLGGHPLAIELAAEAGVREGASEVAQRLEEDLGWLRTARRDAQAQHRTLQQVLETTWERLEPALAQAAVALSVFSGSFDAPAADGVASVDATMLQRLVDRSLLTPGGGTWSMHLLVRRFLADRGGAEDRRRRHADWHLLRAVAATPGLRQQADPATRDDLAGRWAELVGALRWLVASSRVHDALDLAHVLCHLAMWMGWERHALALLEELQVFPPDHPWSGKLLFTRAQLAWRCRGAASAVTHAEIALGWAAEHRNAATWVETATFRGAVARNVGQQAEGVRWLELAEREARELPPAHVVAAMATYQLALARYDAERLDEALALLRDAMGRLQASGAHRILSSARSVLGVCLVRLGDPSGLDAARDAMREHVAREWDSAGDAAAALALALLELRRPAEAARAARSAEAYYARMGFAQGIHVARFYQLVATVQRRSRRETAELATTLVDHALSLGGPRPVYEALVALALLHAITDRPERGWALAARLRAEDPPPSRDAHRFLVDHGPPPAAVPVVGELPSLLLREHAAFGAHLTR